MVDVSATTRDSDASGESVPVREGDRFVEHATDAVLTVLDVIEHAQGADVRVESEHPTLGTAHYRRSREDVRDRVRDGCWSRLG